MSSHPSPLEVIESTLEEYEGQRHYGADFVAAEILRRLSNYEYEVR